MAYIGRDTDKISNVEVLDNITFDGSSSYTLQKGGSNFTPSSANTLLVSIDGVVQAGNFTVSGSTINFGTAVAGTSTCNFILHYGVGLITAPADGTVTTAKLADSSVSLAKLTATGTKDATTFLRGDNTFATAGGTNTPIVFVKANTTTSLANTVVTKINLANEIIDTDNLFASNRFTVTSGFEGKYLIIAQYSVNISTDSVGFDLDIQKNGSSYTSAISKTNRSAIDTYSVGCSAIVDLTTNDYIEMFAYQATGGTITVNANDNRVFLGITKLIE